MTPPLLLTQAEAAAYLGTSRDFVAGLIRCGKVDVVEIGANPRVPRSELERWVRESAKPWSSVAARAEQASGKSTSAISEADVETFAAVRYRRPRKRGDCGPKYGPDDLARSMTSSPATGASTAPASVAPAPSKPRWLRGLMPSDLTPD